MQETKWWKQVYQRPGPALDEGVTKGPLGNPHMGVVVTTLVVHSRGEEIDFGVPPVSTECGKLFDLVPTREPGTPCGWESP